MAETASVDPRAIMLPAPTLAEVRAGLPTSFLDRLKDTLDVAEAQLAGLVGNPRQTLVRRRLRGVLRRDEGDRAATVARVFNAALA